MELYKVLLWISQTPHFSLFSVIDNENADVVLLWNTHSTFMEETVIKLSYKAWLKSEQWNIASFPIMPF